MGLLKDQSYWANVVNKLWDKRPARNEPMSHEDAADILRICCKSLTDLVGDREFEQDVATAVNLIESERHNFKFAFEMYVEEFERTEKALVIQSGVYEGAARDLASSVRKIGKIFTNTDNNYAQTNDLEQLIRYSKERACDALKTQIADLEKRSGREMWERCWQATKGVATSSINIGAGSTVLIDPVTGVIVTSVVGPSIGFGYGQIRDAWNGYW